MKQSISTSLNAYQKRQATLLYYFSSMEFLDIIIQSVQALTGFTDQTLDYVARVERDKAMRQLGWSDANLSSNWSTHAHPMLRDCLQGLFEQKAKRVMEWYDIAGINGTLTGMSHFSMNWTLPEEEEKFNELSGEALGVGAKLDTTVNHTWTDSRMATVWDQYQHLFPRLPLFRIREDVEGESGKRPVRTGVYVPQDDPYGTLQFAWTGNSGGALAQCETLSDLAREYLTTVGREKLWRAPSEALKRADRVEPTDKYFNDWCREQKGMKFPDAITSRNDRAYAKRSCKWYFVEQVGGEFEGETPAITQASDTLRCRSTDVVPRSGWWHSPALNGQEAFRHLEKGDKFPDIHTTDWGAVIWYYEPHRQK